MNAPRDVPVSVGTMEQNARFFAELCLVPNLTPREIVAA